MKVSLPIWQGKVAGVFDFADVLLLVDMENGIEKSRNEVPLTERSGPERVGKLRQLDVQVLICGAISKPLAEMVHGAGIEVLPFVSGTVEQVLAAYKMGKLDLPQYAFADYGEGVRPSGYRHRLRHSRRR